MATFELFSRRKLREAGKDKPDVLQYEMISDKLRVQLQQIMSDAIGTCFDSSRYQSNSLTWEAIRDILRRELGVHSLAGRTGNAKDEVIAFFAHADIDGVLDATELCCRYLNNIGRSTPDYERKAMGITQEAQAAIDEINERFLQAGLGYRVVEGMIIRIDSEFAHAEVVVPALSILRDKRFAGAQQEFLEAHQHYRAGEHEQAVVAANKAFESTLKTICTIKGWAFSEKARASDLIKIVRQNGLFPDHMERSFDQLAATLASGLPEVRNNQGGHGQGAIPRQTPAYVAAYALHLAAAKIIFLADAALS